MFKKLLVLLLVLSLVLTVVGVTGCKKSAETPKVEQVLRYNVGAEPQFFDPRKATGIPEFTMLLNLFDGLMRYNLQGQLVPSIAEKYEVSDDGLTWTFHLRDAKWSNGEPVTAYDFEYSWKSALSPEINSEYAYQLYYLKNGEAYNTGKITDPAQVGVKALDDKTLVATLEAPTPYFSSLLTFTTYLPS